MITFAKGVTSGYLPLGGVSSPSEVAAPFFAEPGRPDAPPRRRPTPATRRCCAAALAMLDIYEREGLIERGRTLERPLRDALAPLADHAAVGEVRAGTGLLGGRRCSSPRTSSPASPPPWRSWPARRARPAC